MFPSKGYNFIKVLFIDNAKTDFLANTFHIS